MRRPPSDSPHPEVRRSFLFGLSACACRLRRLRSRPGARATVVAPCSGRVRASRYSYERRFVKRELQKSTEKVENQPKMIGKAALVLLLFAF